MKNTRWTFVLLLLLVAGLASGCLGKHEPRLSALDTKWHYDTSKLSRSARAQLRKDPGAPRSQAEIVKLGYELLLPEVRSATPLPEFAKAGCDELRMSRFIGALRTVNRPGAELKALNDELIRRLPDAVEVDYESDIFDFYYTPGDLGPRCTPGTLQDGKAEVERIIREILGDENDSEPALPFGRPAKESMWLDLFRSAIELESESWTPVKVVLTDMEGPVHGDAVPGGPIRLNLRSCRANVEICEITLAHELFHMVQFERGFREKFTLARPDSANAVGNPGAWFSEGTASWAEWIATDRLVDVRKLEEMYTKPGISAWLRSYGFTPAVGFMNTKFVQRPTLRGVPGYPGAGVSALMNLLESTLVRGRSRLVHWRDRDIPREAIGSLYAALFTQLNSEFVGEEERRVRDPESTLRWDTLRSMLKPYVVPLAPPDLSSPNGPGIAAGFQHQGSVAPQAARVFRFARAGNGEAEGPLILRLELEAFEGAGALTASLLGATFDADYACEYPVEVGVNGGFRASRPLGCILEMGPGRSDLDLKVHLEADEPAVTLAVMGVRRTSYSLSAHFETPPDTENRP